MLLFPIFTQLLLFLLLLSLIQVRKNPFRNNSRRSLSLIAVEFYWNCEVKLSGREKRAWLF